MDRGRNRWHLLVHSPHGPSSWRYARPRRRVSHVGDRDPSTWAIFWSLAQHSSWNSSAHSCHSCGKLTSQGQLNPLCHSAAPNSEYHLVSPVIDPLSCLQAGFFRLLSVVWSNLFVLRLKELLCFQCFAFV